MSTLRLEVPRAFKPLLLPRRYKGAYGGRGGAKSHFFAEQLVAECFRRPTRAVGIREVQLSIRDSVRQLLSDKIQKLGLGKHFDVLDTEIRGIHGSNIIFRGMQSYNAETIKSLEGVRIAWVEEAQTLSQRSLELLRPTIRGDESEIWCGWNPRFRTDPVDQFFRKNPMPASEMVSVCVNWQDNPWFPEVLRKEMEHDRSVDPELAEHIWDGGYGNIHGAILAKWIDRAERAGRIGKHVQYEPQGPGVEISSDIGVRDTATWWFWQRRVGGYAVLDCDGDSGLDADEWIPRINERLKDKGFNLGRIWLPHDARNKNFNSKYTAMERFLAAFGPNKIGVVPVSKISDRINAARLISRRVEFNSENCEKGLDALRAWEFEWNDDIGTYSRDPLHNWASHYGDGYSYGCQVMQGLKPPEEPKKPEPMRGVGQITVDELHAMTVKTDRTWA